MRDDRNGWLMRFCWEMHRFTTIATGLSPGVHTVTCVLSSETLDPDGGTEFRLISLMRRVPSGPRTWVGGVPTQIRELTFGRHNN